LENVEVLAWAGTDEALGVAEGFGGGEEGEVGHLVDFRVYTDLGGIYLTEITKAQ